MNPCFSISEITKTCDIAPLPTLLNELKITNVSSDFINDIKLIIHDTESILKQSVIRERGALDFDPHSTCLELGNLAPNESAYFEYKFTSPNHLPSLTPHFSLIYTESSPTGQEKQKIITNLLPLTD